MQRRGGIREYREPRMQHAAQPAEDTCVLVHLARPDPQSAQHTRGIAGRHRLGQRHDESVDLAEMALFQVTQEVIAVDQAASAPVAAGLQLRQALP